MLQSATLKLLTVEIHDIDQYSARKPLNLVFMWTPLDSNQTKLPCRTSTHHYIINRVFHQDTGL